MANLLIGQFLCLDIAVILVIVNHPSNKWLLHPYCVQGTVGCRKVIGVEGLQAFTHAHWGSRGGGNLECHEYLWAGAAVGQGCAEREETLCVCVCVLVTELDEGWGHQGRILEDSLDSPWRGRLCSSLNLDTRQRMFHFSGTLATF